MDPDLIFLLGIFVFFLSVPATISAFSTSGKTLRPAAIAIIIGGALIVWASSQTPGGYSITDVPALIKKQF
jgi:hypothetical protein